MSTYIHFRHFNLLHDTGAQMKATRHFKTIDTMYTHTTRIKLRWPNPTQSVSRSDYLCRSRHFIELLQHHRQQLSDARGQVRCHVLSTHTHRRKRSKKKKIIIKTNTDKITFSTALSDAMRSFKEYRMQHNAMQCNPHCSNFNTTTWPTCRR